MHTIYAKSLSPHTMQVKIRNAGVSACIDRCPDLHTCCALRFLTHRSNLGSKHSGGCIDCIDCILSPQKRKKKWEIGKWGIEKRIGTARIYAHLCNLCTPCNTVFRNRVASGESGACGGNHNRWGVLQPLLPHTMEKLNQHTGSRWSTADYYTTSRSGLSTPQHSVLW
jgi:hypothetical protein